MQLKQLFKMVLINIYTNKIRTFLTTLGVIVGTATIFLVVAIGKGGEAQVNQQYSRLNVGTIMVMPAMRGKVISPLSKSDAELFQESPYISVAFPILSGRGDISYNSISCTGSFSAIEPEFQEVNHFTLKEGSFLSAEDESNQNKYVILGAEIAETLKDGDPNVNLIGETITVSSRRFKVIGILDLLGDSGPGLSYDESVFVPYTVGQKYLLGSKANPTIVAQAADIESVQNAIADITSILDENHRIGGAGQFRVRDAGSRLAAAQESARTMSLLLLAVAIVVLIVSGIGIMNVMFVSVKERTKEIGTLKAIGAKKKEILTQFLSEAVVISLVGGIIGVIIGGATLPILSYFSLPALPSLSGVLLGLLFSAITGIFFGFYPALKAASLNPIEALRYE